jgi:hypothetical protein
MIIREMRKGDVLKLMPLFKRCFEDIEASEDFNAADSMMTMLNILKSDAVVLVCVEASKFLGIIAFMIVPSLFNKKYKKAVEVFWHPDPLLDLKKKAKVMVSLFNRAKLKLDVLKVNSVHVGVMPKNKIGNFLQRKGFLLRENNYVMEVC